MLRWLAQLLSQSPSRSAADPDDFSLDLLLAAVAVGNAAFARTQSENPADGASTETAADLQAKVVKLLRKFAAITDVYQALALIESSLGFALVSKHLQYILHRT